MQHAVICLYIAAAFVKSCVYECCQQRHLLNKSFLLEWWGEIELLTSCFKCWGHLRRVFRFLMTSRGAMDNTETYRHVWRLPFPWHFPEVPLHSSVPRRWKKFTGHRLELEINDTLKTTILVLIKILEWAVSRTSNVSYLSSSWYIGSLIGRRPFCVVAGTNPSFRSAWINVLSSAECTTTRQG